MWNSTILPSVKIDRFFGLLVIVFCLVAAAFTTIYIPQPVLPIIQADFNVDEVSASITISAVILGIGLSNLPFGKLADSYSIKPIILAGGIVVTLCGLFCSVTESLPLFVAARFVQGLSIPSMTTCIAAYLARNLPAERLNVVMGSYVSATVAGGLAGRLLGGWVYSPQHWRMAFASASVLLLASTIIAVIFLPVEKKKSEKVLNDKGFLELVSKHGLLRIYLVAFGSYFVFSSIFNYMPFYLAGPSFNLGTESITMMYLTYITGIIIGPIAGTISNRVGNGTTMVFGTIIFALSVGITLINSVPVIVISLIGICAGFFSIHAAAAGLLNYKLKSSRGRANSLYVLFYYLGGSIGITISGYAYLLFSWHGVVALGFLFLLFPLYAGIAEKREFKGI